MKPIKLKIMIGAFALLFLLATSAWADGRGKGHHRHGGHGYKKHNGHHYKGHGRHYKKHYRHKHHYRHHRGPKYYKPYRHYTARHPNYGYGLYFSIFDPHFSFGIRTGGYR